MQRVVLIVTAALIAAVGIVTAVVLLQPEPRVALSKAMLNVEGADIGGSFTLIDQTGTEVTDADVIDKPALLYFGYTFCPDVCPVDVQVMAEAVDLLANDGIDVRPVFISIDPARDTVAELGPYAEAMHPEMTALTGSDAQVAAAAKAYRVFYSGQDAGGSAADYLMQHSTFTYLVVPGHGVVAMFRNGFPPEQIAEDTRRVLDAL